MTTRTTVEIITFRSPFSLPGWSELWSAGDYSVTTEEELLDTSFPAYRRVSTVIALTNGGATVHATIAPSDLAAAIERDTLAGK